MVKRNQTSIDIEKNIKNCYSTWGEGYYQDFYGDKAAYPPVNLMIIKKIIKESNPQRILDAGCGPASMLRHFAKEGRDLYGFDLTPEMILEAKKIMSKLGVNKERLWEGSVSNLNSFFCKGESSIPYNAIICSGVFPHLSENDEFATINNIYSSLGDDGVAIVEARNAFFSLFSLNRYTHEFFIEELIPTENLRKSANNEEFEALTSTLENIKSAFRTDLPPIRLGKSGELGYDQVLSKLHNPLILERSFKDAGFKNVETLFYHYHALPPRFSAPVQNLFLRQSLEMEKNPRDWRGYFMASAFLLVAKK